MLKLTFIFFKILCLKQFPNREQQRRFMLIKQMFCEKLSLLDLKKIDITSLLIRLINLVL